MADHDRKVPLRATGFNPSSDRRLALLAFILLIILWQIGSNTGNIPSLFLPSPYEIGLALWHLLVSGELWKHLEASLFRLSLGWLLGSIVGIAVGLSVGIYSTARSIAVPFVSALFPIPKIALIPLFIIWFGIGEPSKVATIFFGVFFPTVINCYSGVDNISRGLIRMGQSFGLSRWQIIREIILPGAMPGILAGFRISASIGIILLVAAEMIGAEYGIGALVLMAGNLMQTDQLLAGVVMLSCLGLCVAYLLGRLEKYLLRWR